MDAEDNLYRPPKSDPTPKEPMLDGSYRFKRDPHGLTTVLIALLWVSIGMDIIALVSDGAQLSLLNKVVYTPEEAEANDARQGMVQIAGLVVFIVTGIPFLMWSFPSPTCSSRFKR